MNRRPRTKVKKAANKRGGDRIWGTDLKFSHLNETACFTQNDAVSYIKKKRKKKKKRKIRTVSF